MVRSPKKKGERDREKLVSGGRGSMEPEPELE
jgi:hypothetical protein